MYEGVSLPSGLVVKRLNVRTKAILLRKVFFEDAKTDDVHFPQLVKERDDGTLVLGSIRDLTRYSAKSCLSTADLKLDRRVNKATSMSLPIRVVEITYRWRSKF